MSNYATGRKGGNGHGPVDKTVSISLPTGAIDETGHRYGRLVVEEYAGTSGRKAIWWCRCDCGTRKKIRATKFRAKLHPVVSCGCERADPQVRQAARMKVSARRRRAIAKKGAKARWSKA